MKLLKWYFAILMKIEWKTFREKYIARYITFAIDIYIYLSQIILLAEIFLGKWITWIKYTYTQSYVCDL